MHRQLLLHQRFINHLKLLAPVQKCSLFAKRIMHSQTRECSKWKVEALIFFRFFSDFGWLN